MFKTTETMKKFENKTQLESYIYDNYTSQLNEVAASEDNKVAYNFDIGNGNWSKWMLFSGREIAVGSKTSTMPTDFSDFELADVETIYKTITEEFHDVNDWSNLEIINIPDEIETIEDGAFSNCTKLTRVVIGRGLKNMTAKAFEGCPLVELIVRSDSWDWKNNKFLGFPYLSYVRVHGHRLNSEELLEFTGGGGYYGSESGSPHLVVVRTQSDVNKIQPGMSVYIPADSEVSGYTLTTIDRNNNQGAFKYTNNIVYSEHPSDISAVAEISHSNAVNLVISNSNGSKSSSYIIINLAHPCWIEYDFFCDYEIYVYGGENLSGTRGLYLPFDIPRTDTNTILGPYFSENAVYTPGLNLFSTGANVLNGSEDPISAYTGIVTNISNYNWNPSNPTPLFRVNPEGYPASISFTSYSRRGVGPVSEVSVGGDDDQIWGIITPEATEFPASDLRNIACLSAVSIGSSISYTFSFVYPKPLSICSGRAGTFVKPPAASVSGSWVS